MDLSKKTQCGRYFRGKTKTINRDESEVQKFADDYLNYLEQCGKIGKNWRVILTSIQSARASMHGFPDNCIMIAIPGTQYCVCCNLEHKTKSKLHGKQAKLSNILNYGVTQTEQEIKTAVDNFINFYEDICKLIIDNGLQEKFSF